MPDLYHMGEVIGGSVPINDNVTNPKMTWSSEKIDEEIDGHLACPQTTAGTYTLRCTVDAQGNKTYSWVDGGD